MSDNENIILTQAQKDAFFQSIHDRYIQPELDRRFGNDGIPDGFAIREYLIMFPVGQPPVVKFNDEFGWLVQNPELSDGRKVEDLELNEPVYIHEILSIDTVLAPKIDDKHVFFLYGHNNGFGWVIFVGSPDDPSKNKYIAHHLQQVVVERVVRWAKNNISQIRQIGLWIATPLLPFPLSKIVERVDAGEPEQARQILVKYCDSKFVSNLIFTWKPIEVFNERLPLFEDAVFAHVNGKFRLSIHALIPHIEGIIVDWLHTIISPTDVKWRTSSRIQQFGSLLDTVPELLFAYKEALESTFEFLEDGEQAAKPFQAFKQWIDTIDPNFPARHALSHGKYVENVFTEENSIKLFLLLDTICQFMMFYEVRVLKRNLQQHDTKKDAD